MRSALAQLTLFILVLAATAVRAGERRPELDRELLEAAARAEPARCRELLRQGASPAARGADGRTPLMVVCSFPPDEEGDPTPDPADRLECARALIAAKADVNARTADGSTALMEAAASRGAGNELLRLLLKSGAGVNLADRQKQTALMFASGAYGDPEAVRILLAAKADLRAEDWEGHTALWRATSARRPEIMAELLRAGARE